MTTPNAITAYFANPARFLVLSTALRPIIFWLACTSIVLGVIVGLFFSPADHQQGDSVRIMYVHVPAAWLATFGFSFIAGASFVAFVWRHALADEAAKAAAPFGLAMAGLTLFTGAIWGKPIWNAWWVWDARLTSVLALFFIYLGYIAVWDAIDDKARAAKVARIVALVGFANVPIVKFSVDWWYSLHQPASIIRDGGPSIDGAMLAPLIVMIVGYLALFGWYVLAGVEASILEQRRDRRAPQEPPRAATFTPAQPSARDGEVG